MRLTISSTPRRRTVAGNSTSRATPWHRQRCFGHVTVRRTPATAEGELLVDGGVAAEGDAVGLPCVRLLQAAIPRRCWRRRRPRWTSSTR